MSHYAAAHFGHFAIHQSIVLSWNNFAVGPISRAYRWACSLFSFTSDVVPIGVWPITSIIRHSINYPHFALSVCDFLQIFCHSCQFLPLCYSLPTFRNHRGKMKIRRFFTQNYQATPVKIGNMGCVLKYRRNSYRGLQRAIENHVAGCRKRRKWNSWAIPW